MVRYIVQQRAATPDDLRGFTGEPAHVAGHTACPNKTIVSSVMQYTAVYMFFSRVYVLLEQDLRILRFATIDVVGTCELPPLQGTRTSGRCTRNGGYSDRPYRSSGVGR